MFGTHYVISPPFLFPWVKWKKITWQPPNFFPPMAKLGGKPLRSPIFHSCFFNHRQTLIQKTKSYLPCFGMVKIQIGLSEKNQMVVTKCFFPPTLARNCLVTTKHSFHLTPPPSPERKSHGGCQKFLLSGMKIV